MAAGVPVLAVAVLAAEVQAARGGTRLDDVELTYADDGDKTAVWLGDSTAFGIGVTDGLDGVASLVAEARHERVVMLAVSGATLHDVVNAQIHQVDGRQVDRIYISVGANDVTHLTKTGDFRTDYRDLLARLPADVPVTVLGVPDMGAPTRLAQPLRAIAGYRGRQLDAVVRSVVRAQRRQPPTTYVDIEGRTGRAFRDDPHRYFAADQFHPSPAGYGLWADAVLATV